MEASILNGLQHHLMAPELFKEFADEFFREVNRLRQGESARLDGARSELRTIERRIQRIVDAIADGTATKPLVPTIAEV